MSIEQSIGSYNGQCVLKIKQAIQMLDVLIKTDQGVDMIKKKFE